MLSRIKRLMLLAVLPAALAAGCGGGSKTTSAPATTTAKQKADPSAQSAHYHVGEQCRPSLAFAYSAHGFSCVNGKLRHKSQHAAPATVHHHSQTTTAAPQGY